MNKIQIKAVRLMQSDLRLIYTVMQNCIQTNPTYYMALMPYLGIIINGIENWINSYNNSMKTKLELPTFTDEEKIYYEAMRNSSKIFDNGLKIAYKELKREYKRSKRYFTKFGILGKRDFIGMYTAFNIYCDNTILDSYYAPDFSFCDQEYGHRIKQFSIIAGKYIRHFDGMNQYKVKSNYIFDNKDFGGKTEIPTGNKYSMKFFLLSIYCQVNFVIYCVDDYIDEETPSKLRFAYVLYYYLLKILPEINLRCNHEFALDSRYYSELFRNAMMHYKLGVALKENELIGTDYMFGLTQKYFNEDYSTVKDKIISELKTLSFQIKNYLNI